MRRTMLERTNGSHRGSDCRLGRQLLQKALQQLGISAAGGLQRWQHQQAVPALPVCHLERQRACISARAFADMSPVGSDT